MCVQVVLNYALPDWTQPTLTCYCTSMLFASIHVVGLSILAFQQTSLMVVCVSCCNGRHIFDEGILNVNLASCMHCIRRKTFAENGINFERLCHHNVHCAFTCPPKIAPSFTQVHNPSRSVQSFLQVSLLWLTHTHTQTHTHGTSVARGRIFALCAFDAA